MYGLGDRIKEACERKDILLAELAKLSGVPKASVHSWTIGREPKLEGLNLVAKALEIPFYKLAFSEPDPHEIEADVILKELFTGDVRVTLQRIERSKE